MRDDNNKKDLFDFLSGKLSSFEYPVGKEVYVTSGTEVLSKGTDQQMDTCDHEEADTRLLVHIVDAIQKGHSNCLIRTIDTDVIVILVVKFFYLLSLNPNINIWVAFGKGKNFSNWHINSVCTCWVKKNLQHCQSSTASQLYYFTGCDTTSGFYGKGKKIAWEAWKSFPDITRAFTNIAILPFVLLTDNSHTFSLLERVCSGNVQ